MNNGSPDISLTKIKKGLVLFAVFTIAGAALLLYRTSVTESISHLRNFKIHFLGIGIALVIIDWFLSAARIYVFAAHVNTSVSFTGCIRASLANIFMGGITPSQTGGGAAQIYVLYKEGMSVMEAAVVSILSFISTVFILPVCGIAVNVFVSPVQENFSLKIVSAASIILFSLILALVVVSLINPEKFASGIRSVVGYFPLLKRYFDKRGTLDNITKNLSEYHKHMTGFMKYRKKSIAAGSLLTALIFFNKFFAAYIVLQGLGIEAPFWDVLYLKLLVILGVYFIPTPGGTGGVEAIILIIMVELSGILPESYLVTYTFLWRSFTQFIGMAAGSIVLLRHLLSQRPNGLASTAK